MEDYIPLRKLVSVRCPCGRSIHDDRNGPAEMYTINKNGNELILLSLNTTKWEFFCTTGTSYDFSINFIKEQKKWFPEKTCPFILSYLFTEQNNVVGFLTDHVIIKKIFQSFIASCESRVFEPPTQSFRFENNDPQVASTIIKIEGQCPCGYKHQLGNQIYDMVFLFQNRLVGIDFRKSLLSNLFNICEQCGLDLCVVMYVFKGLSDAFFELSQLTKCDNYCHGKSQDYHLTKKKRISFNGLALFSNAAIENQYIYFIKFYNSIYKGFLYQLSSLEESNVYSLYNLSDFCDSFDLPPPNMKLNESKEEITINEIYSKEKNNFKIDLLNALSKDCIELKKSIKEDNDQTEKEEQNENERKGCIEHKELIERKENLNFKTKQKVKDNTPSLSKEDNKETKEPSHELLQVSKELHQEQIKINKGNNNEKEINHQNTNETIQDKKLNVLKPKKITTGEYESYEKYGSPRLYQGISNKNRKSNISTLDTQTKDSSLEIQEKLIQLLLEASKTKEMNCGFELQEEKEQPKGHKLVETEQPKETNDDGIESKEYPKELSKAGYILKIKTKYSTIQFNGNEDTTVRELISHIKWTIEQEGKKVYCGVLKQRTNPKGINERLNETLSSLKLYRTMLWYE
ncbi:hypothetical protein ENUP19_0364G0036 [Entamoeba nuttalli]|uniref:Uncharacterized protein n=2 Tax=Entamoeba nuttalli TaxID=412467 RepID=K2G5A7_ENTNP|nr:hypothetical protein ENU1_194730 [Entamoeba nuttalli P19]EKE37511.1 hypothetical protein ENU1_194730 [Entamoeba nuttalli P19]|eukprot:XP_008860157.1 hypothetical protein ENU1_194730 [Entamoeba nuttalli P19]